VSSSPAMLGILCVGAPWRDYGRTAHSHRIVSRYVYMESRSRELVTVLESCQDSLSVRGLGLPASGLGRCHRGSTGI
jgi:hypothetical protein